MNNVNYKLWNIRQDYHCWGSGFAQTSCDLSFLAGLPLNKKLEMFVNGFKLSQTRLSNVHQLILSPDL
jgi:hypothetical protein